MRLSGTRGRPREYVMAKMLMGFSWAPAIGQRAANVLVRGLGMAWVDNFILVADTKEELAEKACEFVGGCVLRM